MWLSLALKLFGIGKHIMSAIQSGVKWALSDWKHAVIVILAVFCAYYYLSANKWHGRAEKAYATIERRDQTIADMKAASAKAKAEQIAMNAEIKATYERNAKDADNDHATALDQANDRSSRYLAANRVSAKNSCNIGAANSTAKSEAAASGEGPRPETDLVAISPADFNICTVNTVRMESVYKWGQGLIADGVAE